MYKKVSVALIAASLVGCVSVNQIPLSPDTATTLKNREVVMGKRAKPDFGAMTAGKAAFALVGAFAMISAGNQIVSHNNIQDPALYIEQKLSADMSSRYGTKVSPASVLLTSDDVQSIAKNDAGADLVLDVRTINWSFAYFPTTWNKYRVIYSSRLRLIDARNGKVVAEGGCARVPEETPDAPTYDELLANDAARLKSELKKAADFCVGEFETKVFKF